jgi:hypothetical protein
VDSQASSGTTIESYRKKFGGKRITTRNQANTEVVKPLEGARALCVDLNGTLVKSDTLVDSLLLLVASDGSVEGSALAYGG